MQVCEQPTGPKAQMSDIRTVVRPFVRVIMVLDGAPVRTHVFGPIGHRSALQSRAGGQDEVFTKLLRVVGTELDQRPATTQG